MNSAANDTDSVSPFQRVGAITKRLMSDIDPGRSTCPCCGGEVSALDLLMDEGTQVISFGGGSVRLTRGQFNLLRLLLDAYPRVVAKQDIYERLYPDADGLPAAKIIDVHICKLRPLLDRLGLVITTNWGIGYSLELDEQGHAALLRSRRFSETRGKKHGVDTDSLTLVRMFRQQGCPLTDIARRTGLTFKAVASVIEADEATRASGPARS